MATHRKRRRTSLPPGRARRATSVGLLPLPALGALAFGFFLFFLTGEIAFYARPHPVHWLTAAGGGALAYLGGLFYAHHQVSH